MNKPYIEKNIKVMRNVIEEYHWGSRYNIAALMGLSTPSEQPQAELWMGAHPRASSYVEHQGRWVSLLELINEQQADILGPDVLQMPFLFKVLAAEKPLSLQVHPDEHFAEKGFARENDAGIPLNAFNRNFKDSNAKPECVCAITDFQALRGFRSIDEIIQSMSIICPAALEKHIAALAEHRTARALKNFFHAILTLEGAKKDAVIAEAVGNCVKHRADSDACAWVLKLNDCYPGDPGVLAPLFLNLIVLRPGEAMYVPPGEIHSYLQGMAVELTANSDNVLRGGLTSKHKDVTALLDVVSYEPSAGRMISPAAVSASESVYGNTGDVFMLSKIEIDKSSDFISREDRSIEIILCTEGVAEVCDLDRNTRTVAGSGMSVMIPSSVKKYAIKGNAVLYKAGSVLK